MRNDEHVCREGCGPDSHLAPLPVPRVASSLDDLRVGMVVAAIWGDDPAWRAFEVREVNILSSLGWDFAGKTVILSDPVPVPVSRAAFDRLAEALDGWETTHDNWRVPLDAAHALLAEVRAQEPTP